MTASRTDRPASAVPCGTPPLARALIGLPVAGLLALLTLVSLSFAGWGFETRPVGQLVRDLPALVMAAVAGAGCGLLLGWTVGGRRGWALLLGGAVGLIPVGIRVWAYFTDWF